MSLPTRAARTAHGRHRGRRAEPRRAGRRRAAGRLTTIGRTGALKPEVSSDEAGIVAAGLSPRRTLARSRDARLDAALIAADVRRNQASSRVTTVVKR